LACLLCLATYFNCLWGGFVYDDHKEILSNELIQNPRLWGRAVVSDVWAFKGDRDEPWSNYWRPIFVLWMGLNYLFFGANPIGWHATSIAAHLVVTLLAYRLALRLELRPEAAAICAFLFAVHPAHAESVARASAIPDILMGGFLLSSCLLHLGSTRRSSRAALLMFFLGLLSKEPAIFFPALILGIEWQHADGPARWRYAMRRGGPFVAVALLFLILRYLVLHKMRVMAPGAPSLVEALLSVPSVLMFYLRQTFLPIWMAPAYPLRAIRSQDFGAVSSIIPLAVCMAGLVVAAYLWRRDRAYRLGLLWFLLPLALALDIRTFHPEQIVQNRYLYLSIFGAGIVVALGIHELVRDRLAAAAVPKWTVLAGLCLALPLAVQAHRYSAVWASDISLWRRATEMDPNSSNAFAELGHAYLKAGNLPPAKAALSRSHELNPDATVALLGLGAVALREGAYSDAVTYFRRVHEAFPDHAGALELLASAYQRQSRLDEAISLLEAGRRRMPYKKEQYTLNLAVLHVLAGRKEVGLAELESLRPALAKATNPNLLKAYFYLGRLYEESGRRDEAAAAYGRYLEATAHLRDADVLEIRRQIEPARRPPESAKQ